MPQIGGLASTRNSSDLEVKERITGTTNYAKGDQKKGKWKVLIGANTFRPSAFNLQRTITLVTKQSVQFQPRLTRDFSFLSYSSGARSFISADVHFRDDFCFSFVCCYCCCFCFKNILRQNVLPSIKDSQSIVMKETKTDWFKNFDLWWLHI